MPFRLCSRGLWIDEELARAAGRRAFGDLDRLRRRTGTGRSATSGLAMISSGVPIATTWPPSSPAPGPRSTTKSAARMVSSSCSTTSTVLPRSRRRLSVSSSRRVVALVEADRRLVEDVEHADQARADLRGEPDALPLAARQRGRRAVEGQVLEPDLRRGSRAARGSPSARAGRSSARARRAPACRRTAAASLIGKRTTSAIERPGDLDRAASPGAGASRGTRGTRRSVMKRSMSARVSSDSVSL